MSTGFRASAGETPPAPRQLSPDMVRDSTEHGRFLRLFGGIWAGVGAGLALFFSAIALAVMPPLGMGALMGGAFALVGSLLWLAGWAQRNAAQTVFREGAETSGVVVQVYRDTNVRMNGRHPWRVVYEYAMPDRRPSRGTATFWDDEAPHASKGQRLVVLCDPKRPSRSVLWTRLAGEDGMLAQSAHASTAHASVAHTAVRIAEPAGPEARARIAESAADAADEDDSGSDKAAAEQRSVDRS